MRHLNKRIHLNRTRSHRKALFSNLSASLFEHHRIMTTLAKAKYCRQYAERMITFARRGDLNARRHVLKFIRNKTIVKKLFDELGHHFRNRNGGYTRIVRLGPRRGDAAQMVLLELVGFDDAEASTKPAKGSGKSRLKAAQKEAVEKRETAEPEVSAEPSDENGSEEVTTPDSDAESTLDDTDPEEKKEETD